MDRESILADLFDNPRYQAGWDRMERLMADNVMRESVTVMHIEHELDGRKVVYHYQTEFLVQVGLRKKGSYRTKYRVHGSLPEAARLYNAINIGRGYKKRLIAPSLNKPLLARAWS